MANIEIQDLQPDDSEVKVNGSDLFNSDENFLSELDEDELAVIAGGKTPFLITTSGSGCVAAVGGAIGAAIGYFSR
jgi:lactobin A/cerein 7B family class IIb bacteriocin